MPQPSGSDPTPSPPSRLPVGGPLPLTAVALGGALGTLARWGVERLVVPDPAGTPWATLAVNVVGSLLLAAVVTVAVERRPDGRLLRPFAAVGFCGGFTTFSTFVLEIDRRLAHGHAGVALAYGALSVAAGLAAAAAGTVLARGSLRPAPAGGDMADPDVLDDSPGTGPGTWQGQGQSRGDRR